MKLHAHPNEPVWTVTAQTDEEEDFLACILDALVLRFPPHHPKGEVLPQYAEEELVKTASGPAPPATC